jgi:hypothetical protein
MSTQIDLQQTQVFIQDGFNAVAAVNLLAGYAIGLTSMAIDNYSGIIPTGATFTVGNTDTTKYEVLTHTETSGHTTLITFAPGLVVAAVDDEAIQFLPNQLEVRIGEGNLTYDEKKPRKYRLNRGLIDSVKNDDQVPLDLTMDFVWDHIIGVMNDPPTVEEALKQIGNASNWVTSDPDPCLPYCVDIIVLYTPLCATVEPERIQLSKFRYDSLAHDVKNGSVAMKGSCNIASPIVTRVPLAS